MLPSVPQTVVTSLGHNRLQLEALVGSDAAEGSMLGAGAGAVAGAGAETGEETESGPWPGSPPACLANITNGKILLCELWNIKGVSTISVMKTLQYIFFVPLCKICL